MKDINKTDSEEPTPSNRYTSPVSNDNQTLSDDLLNMPITEEEKGKGRSQTAGSITGLYLVNRFSIVLMINMLFGRIHRLCPHKLIFIFTGKTYTDEFMFLLLTCTCTADITHGSYSMKFF